ncbi:MAG: sugar phosphate nucleotidyltransferase [candidate division WOR-3 bacterium]|nr:sugar phosphate nucleotidyltransferase [candidate division WOR-3 bacterium]
MNVIIPVAGEGIRLKPHTHFLPKCLLYVAGKPILGHILEGLKNLKVSEIVIVLGAKSEPVIQFCKKYNYNFKFVLQKDRLGLGHAVFVGSRGLKGPSLVLLGDTITDTDFGYFCGKENILGVKEVDDPHRFGIVEMVNDKVINVTEKPEKPKSNLAIVGIYYFADIQKLRRAMAYVIKKGIKTRSEYQLTDGLALMIKQGEPFRVIRINNWFDCGTPDALIETNRHLLKKNQYYRHQRNTKIIPPVFIPDSAIITDSIIGPNVSIGEGVKIKNSIIRDSIINNNTIIENAVFEKSIIGQNALVRGSFKRLNVGDSSVIEFP